MPIDITKSFIDANICPNLETVEEIYISNILELEEKLKRGETIDKNSTEHISYHH